MIQLDDARGKKIELAGLPNRIISLIPSVTETLFALGAEDLLVGRTGYCRKPVGRVEGIPALGGPKNPRLDTLIALQPDLTMADMEENRKEDVEALEANGVPVWTFALRSLADSTALVARLGELCRKEAKAAEILQRIDRAKVEAKSGIDFSRPVSAIYLIWNEPLMAAGGDTFINDYLSQLGLVNLAAELPGRYPTLELDWIRRVQPRIIILSTEPYRFTAQHQADWYHRSELEAAREGRIYLADGEWFSWYGAMIDRGFPLLADWVRSVQRG